TIVLLYQPLKNLGGTGQGVTPGLAGARRLYEVLDLPEEPVETPGAVEMPRLRSEVRFEGVSYRYPARAGASEAPGAASAPLVLRDVDLTLRDRKSTRLNSSHRTISYAVFCLKKKKKNK